MGLWDEMKKKLKLQSMEERAGIRPEVIRERQESKPLEYMKGMETRVDKEQASQDLREKLRSKLRSRRGY